VNGLKLKLFSFSVRGELVETQKNTFARGSNLLFLLDFFDDLVKSRHSSLPVPGRQVKTGVQSIFKPLKRLDSGWSLSR